MSKARGFENKADSKTGWGFGKENSQVKLDVTQYFNLNQENRKENKCLGANNRKLLIFKSDVLIPEMEDISDTKQNIVQPGEVTKKLQDLSELQQSSKFSTLPQPVPLFNSGRQS